MAMLAFVGLRLSPEQQILDFIFSEVFPPGAHGRPGLLRYLSARGRSRVRKGPHHIDRQQSEKRISWDLLIPYCLSAIVLTACGGILEYLLVVAWQTLPSCFSLLVICFIAACGWLWKRSISFGAISWFY